ncbi:Indoleamine 2,3-dioxygenase 1 [Cercospora beticola]|uniref:Indoleamine 2,3-dioxygenase n=1 Tax=Cercospora beticola TaxID=122368 RepID=A0A2G5I0G2_CERBT|nr:Indoleamine 2,3-dioxygenase 1 [Cercospora beticola]PIA98266.1 Indoleamine 2,3-dioxygenase 1 [Cercospora beticola]WPA99030.1 hypothetical protein RHO25_003644 [Cercospora beticola]CAK1360336.1 unnamed protein product [Cercospora beticola]
MNRLPVLQDYGLSSDTGFLPQVSASSRLPPHYDPWENLSDGLPDHTKSGTIRQRIRHLETLTTARLKTEGDWRRAYSILSYLISAYIWTGETPQNVIPQALSAPYLVVCEQVEMPPVITYTALILWNTKFVSNNNSQDFSLDNLQVCRSFTDTPDERWFLMICAAMEAKAGPAIEKLLLATNAVVSGDIEAVTAALHFVTETIQDLTTLLAELNHRVNPNIWFTKLRPYLAGSIDDQLPQGISFDNGKTYLRLAGANAGQSSLFQFFDIALGINHVSDFAARMRDYMPGPHARFLAAMEESASIRNFVIANTGESDLRTAYDACLKELEVFRNKHIQIVSRYIVIPAREAARKASSQSSPLESDGGRKELRGVGGAPLMPFLRGMRDETRMSKLLSMED